MKKEKEKANDQEAGPEAFPTDSTFSIRIKFADGETGWAEQLTPDTAKIMNIPVFSDEWLLFDVVELTAEDNDGWRRPKRLLERQFHGKTAFYYKKTAASSTGAEAP